MGTREDVLVTGVAVAAPTGMTVDDYWRATVRGENGIGPITRFDASSYPARFAGEITDFDPAVALPAKLLPQTDRMTQLALVTADRALHDAGVTPPNDRSGVLTACSSGGFEFGQHELQKLWRHGRKHVSAYQSFAWFYAVNTGQISIRHNLRGSCGVLVSDHAGGLDALAAARRRVRQGTEVMVSGGVDASLCPWGWVAQLSSGSVSETFLPFDAAATGSVPGEGGAILILEPATAVARRGGRAYGRIAGYGATFDPRNGDSRLLQAIRAALTDAGTASTEIDVVFADAAGDRVRDRAEADAISSVFGPYGVAVTAPKTMTGRLNSGSAALDVATALLCLRTQIIPPTTNVERLADGIALDLVLGHARPARVRNALVLARGHGGFNAAMVVGAY